ncbi:FERM domain-containing protein 5 [Trichinella patagoniensis]|uniref:FERM domain-containing protein 5 n=1 Tax=Trichinella patagoniensis TaxID=990121 RepID=A0A0V0ZK38_9BILA|nr:FERM domain-containing protein 5 [Trichinella patagoniensis]
MDSKFSTMLSRVGSYSTVSKVMRCKVFLLDDNNAIDVEYNKGDTGEQLLNQVCDQLNIAEKDYFGLRFVDKNRYWIDLTKPIIRQVRSSDLRHLCLLLRVRFFPEDPSIIKEEYTRYLFVKQLRRDIRRRRLYCPSKEAEQLGGYFLQGTLGDYNPQEHPDGYVSKIKMFPNQIPRLEDKIEAFHKTLVGMTPAEADMNILKIAVTLETYGFHPFSVIAENNVNLYLGTTPSGVVAYEFQTKVFSYKWDAIHKFDFVNKELIIQLEDGHELSSMSNGLHKQSPHAKKKNSLRFICNSAIYCKQLWKDLLAQKAFFTCKKASDVPRQSSKRQLFHRKCTFRYSGRVFQELKENSDYTPRKPPVFRRSGVICSSPRDSFYLNECSAMDTDLDDIPEVDMLPLEEKLKYNELPANSNREEHLKTDSASSCKTNFEEHNNAVKKTSISRYTVITQPVLHDSEQEPTANGIAKIQSNNNNNNAHLNMLMELEPHHRSFNADLDQQGIFKTSTPVVVQQHNVAEDKQWKAFDSKNAVNNEESNGKMENSLTVEKRGYFFPISKKAMFFAFVVSMMILFYVGFMKRQEFDCEIYLKNMRNYFSFRSFRLDYYQKVVYDWWNQFRLWNN